MKWKHNDKPKNSAQYAFEKGINYCNQSDFDNAIIEFNEAIKLDPKFTNAYCFRGIVYAKGDLEKAVNLNLNDPLLSAAKDTLSQIAMEEFCEYVNETTEIIKIKKNAKN